MSETEKPTLRRRRTGNERREEVLRVLAAMLEQPSIEKITTAKIASALNISEGLLYRYFNNKSAMFDALIDFVEESLLGLVAQIRSGDKLSGLAQVEAMVSVMLKFADTNRGLARLMTGQALVYESPKLQERMNRLHLSLENGLKQGFRLAVAEGALPADFDASGRAKLVMCYVLGQWHRFVLSGFQQRPGLKGAGEMSVLLRV